MQRRTSLGVSLLILSMVLVAGLIVQGPIVSDNTSVGSGSALPSFTPSFDGSRYSSSYSPLPTFEYLSGKNTSVIGRISTDVMRIDGPGGAGWTGQSYSALVYQLFENASRVKNPEFSDQRTVGGKILPQYWDNYTKNPTKIITSYNVGKNVSILAHPGGGYASGDYACWTQTVYINTTNVQGGRLNFTISEKGATSTVLNVSVSISGIRVWTTTFSPGTLVVSIPLSKSQLPNLPGNLMVNLTLSAGQNPGGSADRDVCFDSVYIYIDCQPNSRAIDLKLNLQSVPYDVGGTQYGTGTVSISLSTTPPYSFTFTSNSTGLVRLRCNSTVNFLRQSLSDSATFTTTPVASYYNVSKLSYLNASTRASGSTKCVIDVLNVSIPHDWTFDSVVLPNGTVITAIPPLVQKYENGSYSWIVVMNVSAITSYRPNAYIVQAHSINYIGSVSTYRLDGGIWNATNVFSARTSMKINSTVQGQALRGIAYLVFFFASNYSMYLNMSAHQAPPDSEGVVSFNFSWSQKPNTNATRPDLWTFLYWSNGTSIAGNWARIKFDLDPPQVRISSLTGRIYVSPTGGTYGAGNITVGVAAPDAHPKNMTLLIDGAPVKTWSYLTSASYRWNTTSGGNSTLELVAYDQFDQGNETLQFVYVDNSAPSKPTLSYPNDNDIINIYTPTIVWGKASDASGSGVGSYTLQLDTSAYFNSTNLRNIPDIGISNYTVPIAEPLSPARWYWHVLAIDNLGNVGNYSVTRSFSISLPTLQLTLPQSSPNIFHSSATGRDYIRGSITLTISVQDSIFKNVTLLMNDVPVQSWNTPTASYGWNTSGSNGRVDLALSSYNLYGSNNKTVMLTVYVDSTGPQAPSLSYPNDGETISVGNPQLTWGMTSDGEGSGVNHYILLLDTSQYFNSTDLRTIDGLLGTNYTVPDDQPLSFKTWYWRVYAVDNLGNVGQYSPMRSFQVTSPGLPAALLLGIGSVVPAIAILSTVVLLRRRRETEGEAFSRKNLIAAYVLSNDGRCMFTHEFKEVKIEPQLLSGFLTAISGMMKEVVGGTGRQLRTIEQPDAKILLEFGENISGALVAKSASREYRRRLKSFLTRFEHDYSEKIAKWDGRDIFGDASEIVEEVFAARAKVTTYPTILGIEDLLVERKIGGVTISVAGKTGSGKTTFCLRHAASLLKRGHPVIIVDGSMPPRNVRKELGTSGVDADKMEEQGLLILYDAYSEISGIESKEKYRLGSPGELNTINLSLSRNLSKLKNATVFFDSLTAMIEYSDLELAADFIRTVKAKLQEGDHTAFFIIDSNAHNQSTLNYINHVMDGEIETTSRRTRTGGTERLVSFKRLTGYEIKTGYHQIQ